MGGVSQHFSQVSGSGVDLRLLDLENKGLTKGPAAAILQDLSLSINVIADLLCTRSTWVLRKTKLALGESCHSLSKADILAILGDGGGGFPSWPFARNSKIAVPSWQTCMVTDGASDYDAICRISTEDCSGESLVDSSW